MIKLISFLVFSLAFIWSWFLFNSKTTNGIGIHAGLQSKLALMIENSIRNAKPNAYNFQMVSLYTKNLEENKISAYFSYRYAEKLEAKESVEQSIKGEAVLNRTVSENPEDQKWVIQSVKTNSSMVEFREGSVINSNPDTATETPNAPEAETAMPAVVEPESKKTE